jgi:hypothetical protein
MMKKVFAAAALLLFAGSAAVAAVPGAARAIGHACGLPCC